MQNTVMAITGAAVLTNGLTSQFTATVGATRALDGCTIEAGATDFFVNRDDGGLVLCQQMAAKYEYATGCAPGGNNTIVCSGDAVNATTIGNCSLVNAAATNRGVSECNP